MRLNNYLTYKRVSGLSIFLMFAGLSIATHNVQANPFATPSLTSLPYTCPANHKMYAVAVNYRPYAPQSSQKLIWKAGTETKDFVFDSDKNLTISFTELVDEVNASTNPFFGGGNGPGPANGTYNNGNENTVDAVNVRHVNNSEGQKHILDLKVNRNVSKIGYKIQDIDSEGIGFVRYRQRVDVSSNGGVFYNLSFNSALQDINSANNVITGKRLQECGQGQCVIDASWSYTKANSDVRLKHSNIDTSGISFSTNYIVGYSDFYFCLAPPKVIIKTELKGERIQDSGDNRDQFQIKATGGSIESNSFTTTGTGKTIINDSSAVLSLVENESYTITERVMNGTTLGNIANYNTTYTCTNSTTGIALNFSSGTMNEDSTTKTRSFDLSNLKYGDEITCKITNTPKPYTFSGIVFNDNGGITNPDPQLVGGIYDNPNFFNGIRDDNEAGIDGMNTVKARLRDCSNNPSAADPISTVDVTNLGKYHFSVSSIDLKGKTDLCIEEIEPNNWPYSVDTTPSIRKFSFDPSILNYRTGVKVNGNTLNLDFGNVIKENTALVLIKSQYVHDCSLTDLTTIRVDYDALPTTAFSKQPIADIEPGQCIAYRIEAINRGNVPLTAIIIKDTLQKTGEGNAFATSTLVNPAPISDNSNSGAPTFSMGSVTIGNTGTVITNSFNLGISNPNNSKAILFNTKYGSIGSN